MLLKLAYKDNNDFIKDLKDKIKAFPSIKLEMYDEQSFKERKKAFAIKNEWGTRMSPFAILIDDKTPIKAFYSEQNNCNVDAIIKTLKQICEHL